jgi:hypothetical protein
MKGGLDMERELYLERKVELFGSKQKYIKQNLQMTVGELIEILKEVPPGYKLRYYEDSYECELRSLLIGDSSKTVTFGD